ncbi:MAG TPA: hypothetical protein ENN66_04725 [Proteobacteria bacterium]|nr:hypothetical protein [Pseudomonadota bacterium]
MKIFFNRLQFVFLLAVLAFILVDCRLKAEAHVYFPHVASNAAWGTEVCLINTSAGATVSGTLQAYRNDGVPAGNLDIQLGPNQRRQVNVGAEMADPQNIGYLIFTTDASSLVGYTKFFQYGISQVAVPAVSETGNSNIYIAHIASDSNWWTGLSLVNTTDATKNLTITFNTGETRSLSLGPKEHRVFTIAGLFGVLSKPLINSGVISNANGVVGLELFGNSRQLSGVVLEDKLGKTINVAHVVADASWWTGIVAYNPSSSNTANLTIQPYNANGTPLTGKSATLGPGQKYIGTPATLGLSADTAWFSISSSADITSLELFGSNDSEQLAGYSLVDLKSRNGVFARLEKQGWTGIALVNPNATSATVTLTAYDNYGNQISAKTINLAAHKKELGTPENIFSPQNLATATYVRYASDLELVGFQLNGDNFATMLDGMPSLKAPATSSDAALPAGLATEVENVLDLVAYNDELADILDEIMDLFLLVMEGDGSSCPEVTSNPATINLEHLPATATVTIDFGQGCQPQGSTSTYSGQATLSLANLALTSSGISADFTLTATQLIRDGVPLLNGSVSGNLSADNNGATITLKFTDLQSIEGIVLNGQVTINASNLSLDDFSFAQISVGFNNFSTGTYSVSSGTLTLTPGSSSYQAVANLQTNSGPVNLSLNITESSDEVIVINTTQTGSLAGYNVTINNLTLNPAVCADYPSSGTINLSQAATSYSLLFTNACDGSYIVSQP